MKNKYFEPELLKNLPDDHWESLVLLHQEFQKLANFAAGQGNQALFHDDFVESMSILAAYSNHKGLNIKFPELSASRSNNITVVLDVFEKIGKQAKHAVLERSSKNYYTEKKDYYEGMFSNVPAYEFTESDFNRVQELINELRGLITTSKLMTSDHRARLLRRLEAMQFELHKRTSDIDRFWGFIGEAGIAVRKFGEDMKPISDRVQEVGRIVIGVILAKEGIQALPEISDLLSLKK